MGNLRSSRILYSLLWAAAILAAAFVFKGNPAVDWIEAGLTGAGLVFVVLKAPKSC
jgi:hypothetical protein